jgi:hypothetical protein
VTVDLTLIEQRADIVREEVDVAIWRGRMDDCGPRSSGDAWMVARSLGGFDRRRQLAGRQEPLRVPARCAGSHAAQRTLPISAKEFCRPRPLFDQEQGRLI